MNKAQTIELTAPTSWQALSEAQVVFVAHVLSQQPSKEELTVRCLLKFTGLHPVPIGGRLRKNYTLLNLPVPSLYRYKRKIVAISDEIIAGCCRQLAFLAEPPGLMLCPSVIAGLYGPDPQLSRNTFEEYLMADGYYGDYCQTRDRTCLHRLMGVLWRKKAKPYADKHLTTNARRIGRSASFDQQQAVFLWWTGLKLWLKEKYADLFTGDSGDPSDDDDAVMNMLYAMTGGRAHENRQVLETPVHEVLHALNTKARQINELNTKMK
jgi:hypothetical protein